MATKIEDKLLVVMLENFAIDVFAQYENAEITEGTEGLEGKDELHGGNRADALYGEFKYLPFFAQGDFGSVPIVIGDDQLFGDNGQDLLVGDVGFLDLIPSGDLSNVSVQFGNDYFEGGNGKDILCGDQLIENTVVKFDFVNVHAHWGNDELHGNNGDDILVGDVFLHFETISEEGRTGDVLTFIHTHTMGHDHLCGDNGNDILVGDEATFIFDVQGTVSLDFSETFADDHVEGGEGNDALVGDTLSFSFTHGTDVTIEKFELIFGDDTLIGGQGDDILYGDFVTLSAEDATNVESGSDTFIFDLRSNDGNDQIIDFDSDNDKLGFVVSSGASITDVDAEISVITNNDSGDVRVMFDSGGIIDFKDIAFTGQDSIGDLVESDTQILIANTLDALC